MSEFKDTVAHMPVVYSPPRHALTCKRLKNAVIAADMTARVNLGCVYVVICEPTRFGCSPKIYRRGQYNIFESDNPKSRNTYYREARMITRGASSDTVEQLIDKAKEAEAEHIPLDRIFR